MSTRISANQFWPIATIAFGLSAFAILISFNLLPAVANAYPYGAFGPALSAFQRAVDMSDLAAIFGDPPDPATLAAMKAGNQLDLYGFIPAYTLFLIAASMMVAGELNKPLVWIAVLLAVLAAMADVMETKAQLAVTDDWVRAESYVRIIAPAAWIKFFALGGQALTLSAICLAAQPRRPVLALIGATPILGVIAAATNALRISALMTSVFGFFWIALLAVSVLALARATSKRA